MAVIKVEEGRKRAHEHELWAARGRAIQACAALEASICSVFGVTADLKPSIAVVVFHKLNAHPQRVMIRDLMKLKFGATYEPFWKSALKQIETLANTRNHIVHWSALAVIDVDDKGDTQADVHLKPATVSPLEIDNPEKLTADNMRAFDVECDFWALMINMFVLTVRGDLDNGPKLDKDAWIAAFKQPRTFPPVKDHPQYEVVSRVGGGRLTL